MKDFWTSRKVGRLRAMWALGASAGEIAAELGAESRNAVIGNADRLNLGRRGGRVPQRSLQSTRPWAPEDRDDVRDLWGTATVDEIAHTLNRTPGQVEYMARSLGLVVDPVVMVFDETESARLQDDRFCHAMWNAIGLGKESPPMIGIDRRPCTKAPTFVPINHLTPVMRSSSIADCDS